MRCVASCNRADSETVCNGLQVIAFPSPPSPNRVITAVVAGGCCRRGPWRGFRHGGPVNPRAELTGGGGYAGPPRIPETLWASGLRRVRRTGGHVKTGDAAVHRLGDQAIRRRIVRPPRAGRPRSRSPRTILRCFRASVGALTVYLPARIRVVIGRTTLIRVSGRGEIPVRPATAPSAAWTSECRSAAN